VGADSSGEYQLTELPAAFALASFDWGEAFDGCYDDFQEQLSDSSVHPATTRSWLDIRLVRTSVRSLAVRGRWLRVTSRFPSESIGEAASMESQVQLAARYRFDWDGDQDAESGTKQIIVLRKT